MLPPAIALGPVIGTRGHAKADILRVLSGEPPPETIGDNANCSALLNYTNNLATKLSRAEARFERCQAGLDATLSQLTAWIEGFGGETPLVGPIPNEIGVIRQEVNQLNQSPPAFIINPVFPNTQSISIPPGPGRPFEFPPRDISPPWTAGRGLSDLANDRKIGRAERSETHRVRLRSGWFRWLRPPDELTIPTGRRTTRSERYGRRRAPGLPEPPVACQAPHLSAQIARAARPRVRPGRLAVAAGGQTELALDTGNTLKLSRPGHDHRSASARCSGWICPVRTLIDSAEENSVATQSLTTRSSGSCSPSHPCIF